MTPENPEEPNAPQPETLDFLFDQIIEAEDRQLAAQQSLDQKVIQVFTGSGIVLGFAAFLATSDVPAGAVGFLIAAGGAVPRPRVSHVLASMASALLHRETRGGSVGAVLVGFGPGHQACDGRTTPCMPTSKTTERSRQQEITLQAVLALAGLESHLRGRGDHLGGGGVGHRRNSNYVRRRQGRRERRPLRRGWRIESP